MKKFLFTLASIVGLAFAANAAAPVVYFTNGQNTDQITEATMAPGETMEFALCLVSMDENYKGSQHSFILVDPQGTIYSGWDKNAAEWAEVEVPDWGPVTMLQSEHSVPAIHLDYLQEYGTADKFAWFGGVGKTVTGGTTVSNSNGANNQVTSYDADGEYMPGNEFGVPSEILYTGHYNMILTNGGAGVCYNKRGWTAANIIVFTVTAEEGWADDYAELKIDVTADHPADYVYPSGQVAGEAISLKIINSAASAPELEVPTINVAGDGTLEATVTITNPNTTGKIMYSLDNETWTEYTEALTYNEAGDYHIYAKVVDGDNESQVADEEFTVRAETTAPAPDFDVRDGKLYAEKEGYTVNLQMKNGEGEWVDVANPYELPAQGNEAQTIEFQAQTVKNTEDNNSAWTPYSVTIPALPTLGGYFVWTQTGDQFEVVYHNTDLEEQGVVFTLKVYDANGNEVQPMDGFYGPLPEGTSNWSATVTADGYQPKSDTHQFTYHTPTYAPEPKFNWDPETLTMTAYVEGDDTYTVVLIVNGTEQEGNTYTATQTWTEQSINFSAYTVKKDEDNNSATVNYGYNPVIIPAKELTASDAATFRTEMDDNNVYIYAEGPNVVLYDANGQEVDPQPLVCPRNEYDPEGANYYVTVSAKTQNDDTDEVHYKPTTTNSEAILVPMKPEPQPQVQDLTGTLVISDCTQGLNGEGPGGYFTVTYDGPEAVTIVVTADAAAKAALTPDAEGKYRLPNYGTYNVKAVASAENYNDKEATKQLTWAQPASAPATEITVTKNDDGTVSIEANGNNPVIDGATTYVRPAYGQGDQTVTVTVTTTDEGCAPTTVDLTFTVPEMLQAPEIVPEEGKAQGTFDYIDGQITNENLEVNGHYYDITINGHYDGTIMYSIDGGENWLPYDPDHKPHLDQNGTYDIIAYELVNGEKTEEATDQVTINDKTALNELVDGKAIANVRYFNMAGQEMQEANGITIVVTTYTDGTRSAVKVVK